jgi:hypothetical protein
MLRLDQAYFLAKRRLVGFKVPSSPYFEDAAATDWFVRTLQGAKQYLEYGSGGSTVLAARLGIPFVAVDSDEKFLQSVRDKIDKDGFTRPEGQVFHYANIGMTGMWGRPIGPTDSTYRQEQFRRYSDPPIECSSDERVPDLVLVDGRFRVACALKALRLLAGRTNWTIAVDDYVGRPEYRPIAEFGVIDELVSNRIAVIRSLKDVDTESLERAIARYETVLD